ncbi:MAG: hypothetical protein IKW58_02395 [Alphaproteobacteria bacterium]|nr:hypothetical protein [Alphaproteobacteria bacterium]
MIKYNKSVKPKLTIKNTQINKNQKQISLSPKEVILLKKKNVQKRRWHLDDDLNLEEQIFYK